MTSGSIVFELFTDAEIAEVTLLVDIFAPLPRSKMGSPIPRINSVARIVCTNLFWTEGSMSDSAKELRELRRRTYSHHSREFESHP